VASAADGAPEEDELEELLGFIKDARGFDFTGYKRASLTRRVRKRMSEAGVATFQDYRDLLEARPGEYNDLFNTVLINVTGFLRDRTSWDHLSQNTIPTLLAAKGPDDPVRVWSAGTASGQEAYSLAVLLCDAMGDDAFRRLVKIYATDIDDEALMTARHARYATRDLQASFSNEQVERYFESDNGTASFRPDLRRAMIFGRHDLVQDPPISRVDLLVCRNTLLYFNAETQRRVLSNFHFALGPDGFLFLGRSEALVTRTNLFSVEDPRFHVFSKRDVHSRPAALAPVVSPGGGVPQPRNLVDSVFEISPLAQLAVSADQMVVAANRHARSMFGIALDQVGRPFKDLEISYRPVELRSTLDQVLADGRPATIADVEFHPSVAVVDYLEIHVLPVLGPGNRVVGAVITFSPTGRFRALEEELERSQSELETAYEELQSTVEELETTNEELHSTNEELETMNEELQSTNEELEIINKQLRDRSVELDDVNSFLESVLGSLHFGVAVVDHSLAVSVWNRRADDLWGVRSDEAEGQHFLDLDIGLPLDTLNTPIRRCLGGESTFEHLWLDAVNRRGRSIVCEVTVVPQLSAGEVIGAIVLMESDPEPSESSPPPPGAANA
jgi:two-component system, chemotaxis family, CheB/CheR fusion protein